MKRYNTGADWPQQRQRSPWGMVMLVALPLIFIGVATWWLESRFGSGVAIMILGGLVGVACVIVGILLSATVQKFTLASAADFNRNLAEVEQTRAGTEKARYAIDKERARAERALTEARARIEVIDARRVDQIAQARAKQLTAQQKDTPTWGGYAEDAPAGWDDAGDAAFRLVE